MLKMPDHKGHQPRLIPGSFAIPFMFIVVVEACGGPNSTGNGEEATDGPAPNRSRPGPRLASDQATPTTLPESTSLADRGTPSSDLDEATPTSRPPFTNTLPETDREALVAFYKATNGENWGYNTNWLSDAPISELASVDTDDDGRVTSLVFQQNGLVGEISPELGNLSSLRELTLLQGGLSGEIPPELGNLANLRVLQINWNQLSGNTPGANLALEFGNLRSWVTSLTWNGWSSGGTCLAGRYRGSWANSPTWKVAGPPQQPRIERDTAGIGQPRQSAVDLSRNQLSEIPPELGNLVNLETLKLSGSQLSEMPSWLGDLASLETLDLSGNQLSEIPSWSGDLASLETLREPVEEDTAGVGQSRQPAWFGAPRQPVERGDTAGVGQPRQPA